jgi:hypothetical protein
MNNALEILTAYRAWVKRESDDMPDPAEIGRAIDAAILQPGSESILLARFNAWRRDDSETPLGRLSMPDPIKVAAALDSVIANWGKL